jgi:hypothetical protein
MMRAVLFPRNVRDGAIPEEDNWAVSARVEMDTCGLCPHRNLFSRLLRSRGKRAGEFLSQGISGGKSVFETKRFSESN